MRRPWLWHAALLRRIWRKKSALLLVLRILETRACSAGALGCVLVAAGIKKLTCGFKRKLVAVNLDVPHNPLYASLQCPGRGGVKQNERVDDRFVAISMRVAPDAEAWCALARLERWGVQKLAGRAAAMEHHQSVKGRARSTGLAVSWIDLDSPRAFQFSSVC